MLPFLKNTKEASASAPVETIHRDPDDGSSPDPLEGAMRELNDALMSKNYKDAADIFKSAFQFCDMGPHEEGPHTKEG